MLNKKYMTLLSILHKTKIHDFCADDVFVTYCKRNHHGQTDRQEKTKELKAQRV
jgi:hypothetical protein